MMPPLSSVPLRILAGVTLSLLVVAGAGCKRSGKGTGSALAKKADPVSDLNYLEPHPIGNPPGDVPWVASLKCVDLDQDGLMDVVFCEAKECTVNWLRQLPGGRFEEHVLATGMRAPVHVEAVDFNKTGRLDLLIASMGEVFPNNDKIGTIFILENDGRQNFTPHLIIENIARVCDVQAADINGDGTLDLVVGQFGYDQGEVRWMERIGPWEFKSHIILNLSGTINVCVADFAGNGHKDIAALVSQEWEEVFLFINDGNGNFTSKVIFGSTNEDYNTSNMSLCDLNKDGRADLLFANGDGFGPSPFPGPRPWHGVQWLENLGKGAFKFHRIGDLAGAYSPVAVDLDGDGNIDVVAVSAFNEWDKPSAVSMVWFKNDGKLNFVPHILAREPIQLLTIDVADFDGKGRPSVVSGAFFASLPHDRRSRILLWKRP
ncbi:MAG: VCBS repeat-containing protein [Opitutaceae bacterium]